MKLQKIFSNAPSKEKIQHWLWEISNGRDAEEPSIIDQNVISQLESCVKSKAHQLMRKRSTNKSLITESVGEKRHKQSLLKKWV